MTDPRLRNRLSDETSPYLLQHAGNPVSWFAWGDEAFALARELDRPVFLSIGYSTCYWCHVMERESFEDPAIARRLDEAFVCIKVDREERPDVDDAYMAAVQLLNRGQGGWPMSVWVEPATRRPFLAGTYYPPEDHPGGHGIPSFASMLRGVAHAWHERRGDVLEQARRVAEAAAAQLAAEVRAVPIGPAAVREAALGLLESFDPVHGGFDRGRNRFPTPLLLDFLAQVAGDLPDPDAARRAVRVTLDAIAAGGVHDQLGGGFHRYAVDPQWRVPHFEKMLYDNGQLLGSYARAYRSGGHARDARVLRSTIRWIDREMRTGGGGLASAQDAEVDAREGASFLWTDAEVRGHLAGAGFAADEIDRVLAAWGLDRGPNFRDPHDPGAAPANVLYAAEPADEALLDRARDTLLPVRDARPQPMRDDKVLAGWNGLAIAGLAEAARSLPEGDPDGRRALELARGAATFVLGQLRGEDGGLLRVHRAGRARIAGFLEDHAWLARGLVALARATGEVAWWNEAQRIVALARDRFLDSKTGAWWSTPDPHPELYCRVRGIHDGATPSPASVMIEVLLDLAERGGPDRDALFDEAARALASVSQEIAERPGLATWSVAGLHRLLALAPERVDAIGGSGPCSSGAAGAAVGEEPVVARIADVSHDGVTMTATVRLTIAPGCHVAAGGDGLAAASIELDRAATSRADLALEADWPAPAVLEGPAGPHAAHVGEVAVGLRLSWTGAAGAPTAVPVVVRWQACDDRACRPPTVARLVVAASPAP